MKHVDQYHLAPTSFPVIASLSSEESGSMPVDLHYICKRGEKNFKWLHDDIFETGNWTAADDLAALVMDGGRIFLHTAQKEPAWHGGSLVDFRAAPEPENKRKIFRCRRDFDYKILCEATWSQQVAVAYWIGERTRLVPRSEYLRMIGVGPHPRK
jgi:hypothetical protein